jgi:hypothetical protein
VNGTHQANASHSLGFRWSMLRNGSGPAHLDLINP